MVGSWTAQSCSRVVLGELSEGWVLGAGRVRAWVFRDGRVGSVSEPAASPLVAGAQVRGGWLFELADGAVLFADTPTGPTRVVQPAWREADTRSRPPQVGALLTVRHGDVIEHHPNEVRRVPLPFPVETARALGSRREVVLPGQVRLSGTWSSLAVDEPEPEVALPCIDDVGGRELDLALFLAAPEGVTRADGAIAKVFGDLLVVVGARASSPTSRLLEEECEVVAPLPTGWWLRCDEHLLRVDDDARVHVMADADAALVGGLGFWGRCDGSETHEGPTGIACVVTPEGLQDHTLPEGQPWTRRAYGPPRVPALGVGMLACSTRASTAPPIADWSDEGVRLAPVFARPRQLVLPPSYSLWLDDDAVFADEAEQGDVWVITEGSTLRLARAPVAFDRWRRAEVAREGAGFVVLFHEAMRTELVRFAADGSRVHARWLGPGGVLAEGPDGRVRAAYPLHRQTRWAAYDADERQPVTGFSFGPAPWAAHVCDDVPTNAWRVRMGHAVLDLGDPDYPVQLGPLVVAAGDEGACVVDVLEGLNGALRREDGRLVGRVEENGAWEVSCGFLPPEPIPAGLIAC
ncbi:MAG: hypothetical protein H6722_10540 [Sandaracinus sp.]|nr:hypothetical protein [Sandaracinus sp.]MCB9623140.1 hypothetical protein [Sandaracinus sp.]